MRRGSWWPPTVITIALLLSLPVLVVVGFVFAPATEVWRHLAATVLPDYVTNSLLLMLWLRRAR